MTYSSGDHDMLALPLELTQKFQTLLAQAGVPINQRPYYHK
jgi:hypothetical protein